MTKQVIDSANLLSTGDVDNITALPPQYPTTMMFLELELGGGARSIKLEYKTIAVQSLSGGETIKHALQNVLDGTTHLQWKPLRFNPDTTGRPRSKMSLELREQRVIVLMLKGDNYRFARNAYPIQVETAKANQFYFDAQCAWLDSSGKIALSPFGPTDYDCQTAYFVANGQDEYNKDQKYISRFNFYLDVIHDQDPDNYTPLAIDPDVGYPGGNTVGP